VLLKLQNKCELNNRSWKTVPFSTSGGQESTIAKLQICANYGKVPSRDDRNPLELEAEHDVTIDSSLIQKLNE